jgi:tetratricopeptide (TPR) repeat protein
MSCSILHKMLFGVALAATLLPAQTANPKQPKPKGPKEVEALQAVFAAQDPDSRIAAVNTLVTKFSDSEFKATAFYVAAFSYQQKNDMENTVVFAEKCLEADPQFFGAQLMIANALAVRTKEFDLDREEKLGRSDKLAKEALTLIPKAVKPNPSITDEQWAAAKKDFSAQAYEALGLAAIPRKKYDVCIEQFSLSLSNAAQPDPATYVRLADCQTKLKKYDDAIASLDKALADPNASAQVKNVATTMKIEANKAKAAK